VITTLIFGCVTVIITMGIQVSVVVFLIRYLVKTFAREGVGLGTFKFDAYVLSLVLLVFFIGHLFQVSIWALLFLFLNEFSDFQTAFYHSTVNFASLGYGDIVMSKEWRLLGALEASNGVLMFGLSAGTILSVMTRLFTLHKKDPDTVSR
jgi:hypothetical protein